MSESTRDLARASIRRPGDLGTNNEPLNTRERAVSRSVSREISTEEEDLLLKELYNYSYKLPPINPDQRRKYRRKKIPQIFITVLQARDLVATDFSGHADPLCVVTCGNEKRETKHVTRTLNPKWNKDNAFSFFVQDINNCDIIIQVLDKKQEMGSLIIKPNYTFGSNRGKKFENKWFDLSKGAVKTGQIQLTVEQQDMFNEE